MKRAITVSGALVIDKPEGPTSHDIVARVRTMLRTRAGHTGTLDPLATGVLVVLLGKATRLMTFFQGDDKVYWAQVALGRATETFDREGTETRSGSPPRLSEAECKQLLQRFVGEIEQQPPLHSAVRVGGQRLYQAARRGDRPERPTRQVTIHSLELLDQNSDHWTLRIRCSSGTYVRTLADDIGKILGCGAHLHQLRREKAGPFSIQQAVRPDAPREELMNAVIPMEELLPDLPRIDLDPQQAASVRHGNAITLGWTPQPAPAYRLFDQGKLVALGRRRLSRIQPSIVLVS